MNDKDLLRENKIKERCSFKQENHTENDLKILNSLQEIIIYKNSLSNNKITIGLYLPLNGEPDLDFLQDVEFTDIYNIALPKVNGESMNFISFNRGDELAQSGFHKLMQPKGNNIIIPDIIILPGLCYGLDGYRLGFGKGYYDRYFHANFASNICKIGVCYHNDLQEYIPHQNHDVKMDYIVTNETTIIL